MFIETRSSALVFHSIALMFLHVLTSQSSGFLHVVFSLMLYVSKPNPLSCNVYRRTNFKLVYQNEITVVNGKDKDDDTYNGQGGNVLKKKTKIKIKV